MRVKIESYTDEMGEVVPLEVTSVQVLTDWVNVESFLEGAFTVKNQGGGSGDALSAFQVIAKTNEDADEVIVGDEANGDFSAGNAPIVWCRNVTGAFIDPTTLADGEAATFYMNLSGFSFIRFAFQCAVMDDTTAAVYGQIN